MLSKHTPTDLQEDILNIGKKIQDNAQKQVKRKIRLVKNKFEKRDNSIMTRISDEDLDKIDLLIEIDMFKSRSEAVANFAHEGIQARKEFIDNIDSKVEQIRNLKKEVKDSISKSKFNIIEAEYTRI